MKKILFAATVYTHLAHFHQPFIQLLQKKGYEIHAVANPNEGGLNEIQCLGVVCHSISFSRNPFHMDNWRAVKEMRTVFENHYFEIIHVHTPIASFLIRWLVGKCSQGKVLYTAHGFHFYKGSSVINWILYYQAEKIAKGWTDGLIVINDEDYQRAKIMGFIPDENLFLINGVGVDLSLSQRNFISNHSIRKEIGIPRDDVVFTCVAEFTSNKNHAFLISAWRQLTKKFTHVHLIFAGTGKEEDRIKKQVLKHQIENVHFLGYRKNVNEILNESDAIVLVSMREGFPKSIMEGMVFGLPAIVTDVRGCRDLIIHNKNGFLVRPDDLAGLVSYLSLFIQDKETRLLMGHQSLLQVRKYSLEQVLIEMEVIYDHFLNKDEKEVRII
ncbi:MAG: glycosyl transferase family 1 [Bacillales bacterium]|jgi:glycosyltransferase involved in cell wall biosynthesis|nr:glycosyl transferase family 1 [Bacillales bacterium]